MDRGPLQRHFSHPEVPRLIQGSLPLWVASKSEGHPWSCLESGIVNMEIQPWSIKGFHDLA